MKQTFLAIAIAIGASGAVAQDAPLPFGSEADAEYARLLWDVMAVAKLVGPGMIHHVPCEGRDPHGMMLETFYAKATINGHEGDLVLTRNYGPESKDWFWAR